jgi:Zn-dependent protease
MGWSWTLGKVAGIEVKMHATFLLLLAFVGLSHWRQGSGLAGAAAGMAFVVALFGCVVLHELGHALTARRYGIATRDITLLPIGGVARLERMPEEPRQEIAVALAGPAVNVAIAAALYVWISLAGVWQAVTELGVGKGAFLERLLIVNLFLVGFNLLPAFPMDGGRVLRALLASRMDYTQATQTAARVGQAMALLFGFVGLLYNPFLIFIALFVWIGAAQESNLVQMKSALGGIPVRHAMLTDFRTLAPADSIERATELILSGSQQDFPVLDADQVVGVLLRSDLFAAIAKGSPASVADLMRRDFPVADSHDMLEEAFRTIQSCACHTLPVLHAGRLVGLVTSDNIGEFLMIQAARRAATGRSSSAPGRPAGA